MATTPSARCTLLELPAELRNEIYEYVLTEPCGIVRITGKQNAAQPGFLMACRQVRLEASPFYYGNHFVINTPFFYSSAASNFFKQFAMYGDPADGKYTLDFGHGGASWNNFIVFLRAVWDYKIPPVTGTHPWPCLKRRFAAFACNFLERHRHQMDFFTILTEIDTYKKYFEMTGECRIWD